MVNSGGTALSGISVNIYSGGYGSPEGSLNATLTSASNGSFSFRATGFGYRATLTPPDGTNYAQTRIDFSAWGDLSRDFVLESKKTVSGILTTYEGTPASGVRIEAYSDAGFGRGSTTTNPDGSYSITGLAPGIYRLMVFGVDSTVIPGLNGTWYTESLVTGVDVTQDATRNVSLPQFFAINGVITDTNAVPVSGIPLTISSSGYGSLSGSLNSSQSTNSDGTFSTKGPIFNYLIRISPLAQSNFPVTSTYLDLASDRRLNVILPFSDVTPPNFVSPPVATAIGQTASTIVWQTDEPSRGTVNWGDGNSITEPAYVTQHSVLITRLQSSRNYSVQVSAYDRTGNGPTTATTSFTTLDSPDTAPPIITDGPLLAFVDPYSTVINWETNKPATTRVTGDATYDDAGYVRIHRAELTGLQASTQYNVTVSSVDANGNGPVSRGLSFKTAASVDTTPPVITKGPWSTNVTADAATVSWETDEPANGGVSYNDGTAYTVTNDDALTEQHSARLTGLSPNTTFNVTVSSKDATGNGPTLSQAFTVRTLAVANTKAPVFIEGPAVCKTSNRLIQICAKTDVPTSINIKYGLSSETLNRTEARAELSQQHAIPINGLLASTRYVFKVEVVDPKVQTTTSKTLDVTTAANTAPSPQFVQAPTVSYVGKDRTVIEWETNRPCNALVEYGVGNYDQQATDGHYKTKQKIVLTNLRANRSYQFRVTATDVDGLSVVSGQ